MGECSLVLSADFAPRRRTYQVINHGGRHAGLLAI